MTKYYLSHLNWVKNCQERHIWRWKFKKRNFEKKASKLFVKLYFRWPPSLSYSFHKWISTESRLFMRGIQNFKCFSTKIQRKLKIKMFDLTLHFWGFWKFCFQWSALFSQIRSHILALKSLPFLLSMFIFSPIYCCALYKMVYPQIVLCCFKMNF